MNCRWLFVRGRHLISSSLDHARQKCEDGRRKYGDYRSRPRRGKHAERFFSRVPGTPAVKAVDKAGKFGPAWSNAWAGAVEIILVGRPVLNSIPGELNRHVLAFRSDGERSPLFCFPGSGGDVLGFRDISDRMESDQPVYGVDISRYYEETQRFTVEQLAMDYAGMIRNIYPTGPYNLCGFSFGALVAFEIARILDSEGAKVGLLALIDARSPTMVHDLSKDQTKAFRKTYVGNRVAKYKQYLLSGDFKKFTTELSAFFISRLGPKSWTIIRAFFRTTKTNMPDIFKHNEYAFISAWKSYVPKYYCNGVVLISASERGPEDAIDETLGWGHYVSGEIKIHSFTGRHVDIYKKQNIRTIADLISGYLRVPLSQRTNAS